ncbi:MAG: CoF synthetase [Flavobacteriaceae bacterium]|nr:CoF synthetase [Flavobacteriaceae bacterium]
MGFLNTFRNKTFWFIDFLKGGPIRSHYREIKFILENYHSEKSVKLREGYLSNLLNHAVSTTPFYKPYQNTVSLTGFPVINKSIVKNNFESFKSLSYNKNKNNFKVATSGSTGTPLKLYQDKNKHNRNFADTIYFAEKAGYKLGTQLIYMRVWTPRNKKSPFLAWMQNIKMQDILNLNDEELAKLIKTLTSNNKKGIISYASSLETICKYLDKIESDPLDCNLNSIISNAEHLNEYTKTAIQKYFKTPVVSRYSNNENGILSQQNIHGGDEFDINWASYFIEILKFEEDTPVKPGELGRVIVTDLFNYCMPLIRYDTGDIACIENNSDNIPVFKSVEGRKLDLIYNTNGEIISSLIIGSLMAKYSDLNQFQFIQVGKKDYVFKLNTTQEFNEESQLKSTFKEHLGKDSNINIEYIEEIPLLASGKRKLVVNDYIKN